MTRPKSRVERTDEMFRPRRAASRASTPFAFVLDELEELGPWTRPMFGCTAVYVDERIVMVLRDRPSSPHDNGVWIATTREHHASLRRDLPGLRSIEILAGGGETGWQVIPAEHDAFEETALRACELVRSSDPRIGKVPKARRPRRRR